MRGMTPYLVGYALWSLGAGSMLSGALFALTRNYTLGIGGKAATWPYGLAIAALLGSVFFPLLLTGVHLLVRKSDRPALSTLAKYIGLLGTPLVAIGILLTALSQLSLINEGWQILIGSLLLYPVYAWALMKFAPAPENMPTELQRWASRLAWVWVAVTFVFGVLWIGGIAFEAPYVTGRGLFRLFGLMFLVYLASMVALYLAGTLNRRWRPLGVAFGWVIGAWLLALAPLILVYTAVIALNNISYIE
jgi:hypothetical protein